MSHTIASDVLHDLGELHFGRKRIQPASREIHSFYERAEGVLKFKLLTFNDHAIRIIAESFQQVIETQRYTCYACAIMPDHVHILIRKHKHLAEDKIAHLQDDSRLRLRNLDTWKANHPVWGGPGWKVFLDHPDDIRRVIRYIEMNPIKARMPAQSYSFVKPYDGWPLHPGHNPNSPYAKRLRGG